METKNRVLDVLQKFIGSEAELSQEDSSVFTLSRVRPSVGRLSVVGGRWRRFTGLLPAQNDYYDTDLQRVVLEDWNLSRRIGYINRFHNSYTSLRDRVIVMCRPPVGLHVFGFNRCIIPDEIEFQLHSLFNEPGIPKAPDSNIIFYVPGPRRHDYPFSVTYPILSAINPIIAKMVYTYAKAVQNVLGASDEDLGCSAMSLVHYEPGRGIKQHIDNITDPDGTIGPLVSIALGGEPKYLDLLPTLTPTQTILPVRITIEPGQVIVMDGDTRLEYSHSVPRDHSSEMFSLLFKFRNIRHTPNARVNEVLSTQIHYTLDPASGDVPTRQGLPR
jgi:alkylated DNA repair dioxygenase AlkB